MDKEISKEVVLRFRDESRNPFNSAMLGIVDNLIQAAEALDQDKVPFGVGVYKNELQRILVEICALWKSVDNTTGESIMFGGGDTMEEWRRTFTESVLSKNPPIVNTVSPPGSDWGRYVDGVKNNLPESIDSMAHRIKEQLKASRD